MKKRSMFSTDKDHELIGEAIISTLDLLSIEEYGHELYLYLEKSKNPTTDSILKVHALFVPSQSTIKKYKLDPKSSLFSTVKQFMLYKALHLSHIIDHFGYKSPLGSYYLASQGYKIDTDHPTPRGTTLLQGAAVTSAGEPGTSLPDTSFMGESFI